MNLLRGWEKLLHQGFLVRLEGIEFLGLRGDEVVEAGEAVGDALLFGERAGINVWGLTCHPP